jgi:hypothetical protein
MNILKNEIEINVPVVKDIFLSLLNVLLSTICVIGFPVLIVELTQVIVNQTFWIEVVVVVAFVVGGFQIKGILWKIYGSYLITIDPKYIIIAKSMKANSKYDVFKIDEISKITIDHDFAYSIWTRIMSFWTRSEGGCIKFVYKGKLVRIGDGLSVVEADELISALKEKQILKILNF